VTDSEIRMGRDLGSWERDGTAIEFRWTGMEAGQLLGREREWKTSPVQHSTMHLVLMLLS